MELNSRIPELEFHQKALEDERDRLNRRNEDLVGELKDAKRKLGQKDLLLGELEGLQDQVGTLANKLRDADRTIQDQKSENQGLLGKLNELDALNRTGASDARKMIESVERDNQELARKLGEALKKISALG